MSSTQDWTIRRVLQWTSQDFAARGLASPRLDAELLLAHALGTERLQLYLDLDRFLEAAELAAMRALVERRRRFEPVAYILGHREFYGRRFAVSPAVLIPRPDTELLIERALHYLPADAAGPVLDVGTGSGCIAITLACERPSLQLCALDVSPEALQVAAANAAFLGVTDRLKLQQGDLRSALPAGPFALITANLPYIPQGDVAGLMPDVRDHEPHLALDGGADGLGLLRVLLALAPSHLLPGGRLLLEVGQGQAADVLAGLEADGRYGDLQVHPDLGGIERLVEASRQP